MLFAPAVCYGRGVILGLVDTKLQAKPGAANEFIGEWFVLWTQAIAPLACAIAIPDHQVIVLVKVKRHRYLVSAAVSLMVLIAIRLFVG